MVLFIGFVLAAAEPLDYLRDNWLDVPRFLAAGFVVALFTTTIPLAVSAFTTRRAYAAAFVIGLFIISALVAGVLTECQQEHERITRPDGSVEFQPIGECKPLTGDAAKWFALIAIPEVPIHVSDLIFDEENDSQVPRLVHQLPTGVPVGWYLLLTVIPGLALLWRYRRIRI